MIILRNEVDHLFFQVSVELASDSRDFATALAKIKMAEVNGKARIVPILQPSPPPPAPPSPFSGSKPPLPPEPVHYTEPHVPHHIQVLQQDTGNSAHARDIGINTVVKKPNTHLS